MTEMLGENDLDDMFDIDEDAERSGGGVVEDPYPIWAELLRQGPVHKGGIGRLTGRENDAGTMYIPGFEHYSVFSFAGVSEVFTRKDDFYSGQYHDMGSFPDTILAMDGTKHRRYRDLIQEHFQPAQASGWWREKVIAPLVEELIGRFEDRDAVDLNSQLFARLPMQTVTAGFGLSAQEGLEFRRGVLAAMAHGTPPEQKQARMQEASAILEKVIRERQAEPRDDVISRLVQADLVEEDGSKRKLTVDEVASFCKLIVFAGGGTTWKQLGITTFALLNNPDQLEAVKADRSLLPKAILESARWYPNDPVFPRKALRDTELQGTKIPEGAIMHLCLGAANRDPSRWESPEKFDLFRPVQRSLAFAAGAHSCLGQHVAREEMLGAINALLDRFPNIRWDPSKPPAKLSGGLISRGPGPLHVLLN
jgi:cytochrome P450